MNVRSLLVFLALAALSTSARAQEVHMRESDVSPAIRAYVSEHCNQAKRLRYFKETESGQQFIEVEFVEDHREQSIKFLNDVLYETEVEIAFDDIELTAKQRIESELQKLYTHYKIIECQEVNRATKPHVEIEVRGSKNRYFELLFDQAGNLVHQSEINVKPIPNQF